ncbi:Transposase, IS4-like protein [Ascosphaera apis ARSEF 7405]|uniref:Transposase, IS4-like protein n=1 Tax=Ascosphaera apis ARSEF 7405 TaxID=392613 RepID=A0A168DL17_9EURO|nr:Transposase, IS4-like protein [Ascosphaera apis ARSEF 7405]
MVRYSIKEKFRKLVTSHLDIVMLQCELEPEVCEEDDVDEDLQLYGELLAGLEIYRYLEDRFFLSAGYISTGDCSTLFYQLLELPDTAFLQKFRVSRPNFDELVSILKTRGGDLYWRRTGNTPARTVEKQVAAALFVLGAPSSFDSHRSALGISKGALHAYLWRTILLLCQLASEYIQWPTEQQRDQWQAYGSSRRLPFKDCIGFIDGSEIQLRTKPEVPNYQRYFSKKKRYGFNLQAVSSFNKRFIYVNAQSLASCHDSTAYKDSVLYERRQSLFRPGEYLLGDKAYELDPYMITPFKAPQVRGERERAFNIAHATERVGIEHTFGVLKARWESLRNLPLRIREEKEEQDQQRVGQWILACVVLHNFLHDMNEDDGWLRDTIQGLSTEEGHLERTLPPNDEAEVAALDQGARRMQAIGRLRRDRIADFIMEHQLD